MAFVANAEAISSDIVGYQTVDQRGLYDGGAKITAGGSAFLSVGGTGYCLNDFKIVDGDEENPDRDVIQFVQTTIAKVDDSKSYFYYQGYAVDNPDDEDYEPAGWMYAYGSNAGEYVDEAELKQPIPAGTGFLCVFITSTAKLQYAGQVNVGTSGLITCARAGKITYVANPLPYDVALENVKVIGGNEDSPDADVIQFMQTSVAKVDDARSYFYYQGYAVDNPEDEDYEPAGWMYAYGADAGEYVPSGTEKFQNGEAVLFVSNTTGARVVFPAPSL